MPSVLVCQINFFRQEKLSNSIQKLLMTETALYGNPYITVLSQGVPQILDLLLITMVFRKIPS